MAKKKFQRPVSTTSTPSATAANANDTNCKQQQQQQQPTSKKKTIKGSDGDKRLDVTEELQLLTLTADDQADALDIPGFLKDGSKQTSLMTSAESAATVPQDAPRAQLPADTEDWLLKELKSAHYTRPSLAELQAQLEARSLKKLNVVYCELLKLGFTVEEVVEAMRATGGYPISVVLDWMAINMLPERLPRSFYDKALYKSRSSSNPVATAAPTVVNGSSQSPSLHFKGRQDSASKPQTADDKNGTSSNTETAAIIPDGISEGELFGAMFSGQQQQQQQKQIAAAPPTGNTITTLIDLPIPKDWTGKFPKSIFIEWYRKELIRKKYKQCIDLPSCGVTFQPIGKRAGNRVRVSNESSPCPDKWTFDMPESINCVTLQQAQHYASVMALYKLEPSSNLYRMLPPAYKDLWMDWKSEKTISEEDASKQELIARLATLRSIMAVTAHDILGSHTPPAGFDSISRADSQQQDLNAAVHSTGRRSTEAYKGSRLQREDLELKRAFVEIRQPSEKYQSFLSIRSKLPVFMERDKIVQSIRDNSICLIVGETGSGKSTQTGQFIMEDWLTTQAADGITPCNIFVTQPRRISAISLAKRVSEEQGEQQSVGQKGSLCGYQIRLESKTCATTRLTFGTVGILLRRLISDPLLRGITHVIVDEIHERSIEIDFLLLLMKRLITKRPNDLKLVLMSATVNADLFVRYFNDCPLISVPGRTHPVTPYYLEDLIEMTGFMIDEGSEYALHRNITQDQQKFMVSKLGKGKQEMIVDLFHDEIEFEDEEALASLRSKCSAQTLRTISWMNEDLINFDLVEFLVEFIVSGSNGAGQDNGSILIFLPGLGEIRELNDRLAGNRRLSRSAWILPLHSSFTAEEQARVFQSPPSSDLRKIVLSTNVAETGVTIPDCTVVIDCGRVNELNFHQLTNTNRLMNVFIAQDSALQRRGRAGRVKPGVCYHLFTSFRYNNRLRKDTLPEIQRQSLDEFILTLRLQAHTEPLREIFNELITPPYQSALHHSIKRLQFIQALDTSEQLTPLGAQLGGFPADAHLAKMALLGALFKCLDPILTIAAILSYKSPFLRPFGKESEASAAREKFKAGGDSDFLSYWVVYSTWRRLRETGGPKEAWKFCQQNFLSFIALQSADDLKRQFHEHLASIGVVPERSNYSDEELNINSRQPAVLNAIISAGLYPKIAMYENRSLVITSAADYFRVGGGEDLNAIGGDERKVSTTKKTVFIHPSSTLFRGGNNHNGGVERNNKNGTCLVYNTLLALKSSSDRTYLVDCAQAAVLPLILFAGSIRVSHLQGTLLVDGVWGFRVCAKTAVILKCLKRAIDREMNSSPRVQQILLRLLTGIEIVTK